MKFHSTNLGKFGKNLITDEEGYAYTTILEYQRECNLDLEEARTAAAESRSAEKELERWQNSQ